MAESDALTHLRGDGSVHMVDVSGKESTKRVARAEAVLRSRPEVIAMVLDGTLPKGEALATARIAGIQAAKRTWELVPLCHPLPLSAVTVDFAAEGEDGIRITTSTTTTGPTGVEMEALTAASIAAVTLYDMIKAVDRGASIHDLRVLAKSGGASGSWERGA